ncbi:MAG: YgfZ/GcvT domain-containing protein, partial [Duodenibacillus sp.]
MTTDATSTSDTSFRLDTLRIIRITGDDRLRFLQGQLTQDVMHLQPGVLTPAGLCSPKGRLLATPRLAVLEDAVLLIVTADQRDALVKRLKMYVLRSKVTVETLDTLSVVAVKGPRPQAPESAQVFDRPAPSAQACAALGLTADTLWALVPAQKAARLPALEGLPAQEVAAGEP